MAYVPYDPNRPQQKTKDLNAQDIDTYKDAEAAKDRFARQVQGAKSDMSAFGDKPYAKSTPGSNAIVNKIMAAKPEVSKPSVVTPTPTKSNLDLVNSKNEGYSDEEVKRARDRDAAKTISPVVKKATPKVKSQFERMQDAYEGFGKGSDSTANKEIQARLEQGSKSASTRLATPEKTSVGAGAAFAKGVKGVATMKKGGSACKGYAKGGSVRSSASSRGDGCATKGHTKGAMR